MNILIVSLGGEYPTINSALSAAQSGDRIEVKAGSDSYKETIVIDKAVELIALSSSDSLVCIESDDKTHGICIEICGDAVVRGFTLTGGIVVKQGSCTIEYCEIIAGKSSGVTIQAGGNPTIRHCNIHRSERYGIHINGGGIIEDCSISSNVADGVNITGSGNSTVRRCKIYHNTYGGVAVTECNSFIEGGNCIIEHCDIYGNNLFGIKITTGKNPTVRGCKIHGGKHGVFVHSNGGGIIEDCDIYENTLSGIEIRTGGNPTVRCCKKITANGYAIQISNEGRGQVENCNLRGNKKGAWNIDKKSQVQESGNQI